jgi:hypothetical protein
MSPTMSPTTISTTMKVSMRPHLPDTRRIMHGPAGGCRGLRGLARAAAVR